MTSTESQPYEPVGDVLKKGIKRELPVRLTDIERLEIAEAKAKLEAELDEHRAEESDRRREASEREKEIEKRIAVMGAELRTREQRRVVICYERWEAGQVVIVRQDVDPVDAESVVERRAANLAEAQKVMPGAGQPAKNGDVLAEAAKMQRDAGIEEDDAGDVVPPTEGLPPARGRKGKAKRR